MSRDERRITVIVPAELHREVKVKAARNDMSITAIVTALLKAWIKEEDNESHRHNSDRR